jgi:hypothetical protein
MDGGDCVLNFIQTLKVSLPNGNMVCGIPLPKKTIVHGRNL